MAKLYGLSGKIVGKKGDAVFRVRKGEQIVSQYNPIVSNPRSDGQTNQRAKFKIMSQLAAVCAPVIAIRSIKAQTPRNIFSKINMQFVEAQNGEAKVDLKEIQLTNSATAMVDFTVTRAVNNEMTFALNSDASTRFDKVVYVVLSQNDKAELAIYDSVVATSAGTGGTFPASVPTTDLSVVALAYGIRENDGRATASLDNITAPKADSYAKLLISREILAGDVTLTKTLGAFMGVSQTSASSSNFNYAVVSVTTVGSGSVSGSGQYILGNTCTLIATPAQGAAFEGYYLDNVRVSPNATFTFTVESDVSYEARFTTIPPVTITLSADPAAGGTVLGGGQRPAGSNVTVIASANNGYRFSGWYEGGTLVSSSVSYNFTANTNRTLVARFEESAGGAIALQVYTDGSHNSSLDSRLTLEGNNEIGETVNLTAPSSINNYNFASWNRLEGGSLVSFSNNRQVQFTIENEGILVASYEGEDE